MLSANEPIAGGGRCVRQGDAAGPERSAAL